MILKHIAEQDEYLRVQKELHKWDHGLVDCEQLEKFCKKHERRKEIKRRLKKMITSIRKNMGSIIVSLIIAIVLIFVFTHKEQLSAQNTSTDWLAQKQPVIEFIGISNGNTTMRINKDTEVIYDPVWDDNGSIECWYVVFDYQGNRKSLELTDNLGMTATEWKESIEACFPVGGSNE